MKNIKWCINDKKPTPYSFLYNNIYSCAESVLLNYSDYIFISFYCDDKKEKELADSWFKFLKDCGCKFTINKESTFNYLLKISSRNYPKYKNKNNKRTDPGSFTVFTLIRYLFEQPETVQNVLQITKLNPQLDPIICLYLGSFMILNTNLGDRGMFSYNHTSLPLIIKKKEFVEYLYSHEKEHDRVNRLFQESKLNSKIPLRGRTFVYNQIRKIKDPRDYKKMLLIFKKYKMLK